MKEGTKKVWRWILIIALILFFAWLVSSLVIGKPVFFQTALGSEDCKIVDINGKTFTSIDSLENYVLSNEIATSEQFNSIKSSLEIQNGKVYSCGIAGSSQ